MRAQGLAECQTISNPAERGAKVKFLTEKVTRAKNVHHSMKVELQDVDPRDQKKYEKKVNDLERRLKKAQTDLRAAKNQTEKADLVEGASPSMKDPNMMQDQETVDGACLLRSPCHERPAACRPIFSWLTNESCCTEAGRIQGKDKQATRRMLKMVAQTEEVAASTMDTMKNQTEQLSKIHSDLEEMDSTLKLADAQIKQYVRKMATDKLIMMMLFIIVVGLIVIMGLKTVGVLSDDQVRAQAILTTTCFPGAFF